MKILVISYLYPNKVFPDLGIFVHNRIKAISKHVEIEVINPIPWCPIYPFFDRFKQYKHIPKQELIDGIKVHHPRFLSIPKMGKSLEPNSYYKAVKKILKTPESLKTFDIVDMHWTFPDLPAGLKIAQEYQTKSIVTLRGDQAFHSQDGDFREHAVTQGLKQVDGIIGVSEHLRKRAYELSGRVMPSLAIRNGVNVERFPYKDLLTCRKQLGLDENQKIILSIGSLIHRKGFDIIIEALSRLIKKEEHKNTHLYIGGSVGHAGDYTSSIDKQIKQYNLSEHVHFVGQIPNQNLSSWYNAANIFCLASRAEGSPNVLTEALSCGTPSITTDVGAAKEIAESALPQCTVIPPDSSSSLLIAIEELLNQNYDRQVSSDHFKKYNWDWCASKVINFYQQILNTNTETSS